MSDVKRYRLGDLLVSDMAGSFADDFMIDASDYDTLVARLAEAEAVIEQRNGECVSLHARLAELEAQQGQQKPAFNGYVLFDAAADLPYIKKDCNDGMLAFFDEEWEADAAKSRNPGTDYKRVEWFKNPQPVPEVAGVTLAAIFK